jgi:hypothetical protein
MKAQSYILRYGSREDIEKLAEQVLQDAGLPAQPEAAALALRAAFAQSLLQDWPGLELSLKTIDHQLFIIGNSDALSFTI